MTYGRLSCYHPVSYSDDPCNDGSRPIISNANTGVKQGTSDDALLGVTKIHYPELREKGAYIWLVQN